MRLILTPYLGRQIEDYQQVRVYLFDILNGSTIATADYLELTKAVYDNYNKQLVWLLGFLTEGFE